MSARPRCLSIGSSDSGGGAGVQGDLKAFTALGAYGSTVLVGVTAQNTEGIRMRHTVPLDVVAAQLNAVLDDIGTDAVKVGATWSTALMRLLGERLSGLGTPVVVDPVLVAASGSPLDAGAEGLAAVRAHLFPVATVITPNLAEARLLAGAGSEWSPARLTEELHRAGASAVLVTDSLTGGGDWLFDGRDHYPIPGGRHGTGCEHGAGCAHSSLLTVLMARGMPLRDAAVEAHHLAEAAVRLGHTDVGRGMHPVNVTAAVAVR